MGSNAIVVGQISFQIRSSGMAKFPDQYQKMRNRHADYMRAVEDLGQTAAGAGPLDEKTRQLVQLAAAAALRSEGGVHSHSRRALEASATPEEIRHTLVVLTSTMGFPAVVAATTWADDVLESE
jgi:AhpD family alkylhydroperoxidase